MAVDSGKLPAVSGVFWDLENCHIPAASWTLPEAVASNVRDFAIKHGRIACFNAYADCSLIGQQTRLGLQQAGVSLLDIPNHAKEAADKAMIVDMCLFAVENKVPATIILISGDRDFANALQRLRQLGYRVVVVSIFNRGRVPNALRFAAEDRMVHDWHALASHGASECLTSRPTPSSDSATSLLHMQPPPPTPPPPPLQQAPMQPQQTYSMPPHAISTTPRTVDVACRLALASLGASECLTSRPTPSSDSATRLLHMQPPPPAPPPPPLQHSPKQPQQTHSVPPRAISTTRRTVDVACRLASISSLPSNLSTSLKDRLPSSCAAAIREFWAARPNGVPIQHPYAALVAHINSRCPQGTTYKVYGYSKFMFLLNDAQSAGLLWLYPESRTDAKGKPFAEVVPVPHSWHTNPTSTLYWQALGFSHEEAQACRQKTKAKAWGDEVVGVLASSSPRFDAELHSRCYFAKVGEQAWAVRVAMKKQRVVEKREPQQNQPQQQERSAAVSDAILPPSSSSAGSLPSTAVPGSPVSSRSSSSVCKAVPGCGAFFPPTCTAAIKEFWATHPSAAIQPPYTELERHIQTRCGGYAALGYDSLFELLKAAQTVGLLWLRLGKQGRDGIGRVVLEAVALRRADLTNPVHPIYWRMLGFRWQETVELKRKALAKQWDDQVVAKLACTSPHFDADLHSRWYSILHSWGDKVGPALAVGEEASCSGEGTPDTESVNCEGEEDEEDEVILLEPAEKRALQRLSGNDGSWVSLQTAAAS